MLLHHQCCGALLMSAVRVVDNRLTIMIASAVGGAIAALMGFIWLKNLTIYVLSKIEERKWVFTATWIFTSSATISHCVIRVWRELQMFLWAACHACTVLTSSSPSFLLRHCSKECLVTSSGIDNTENGLSGSKADSKPTPKKKWESACI